MRLVAGAVNDIERINNRMVSLDDKITPVQTVGERIKQRRYQMLIHSYLYYGLDEALVQDHQWQAWADELAALQQVYGASIGFYDEVFRDWDGSTGYHLPVNEDIREKAARLRLCEH